jgi:broad specificity phosphatase PhoE
MVAAMGTLTLIRHGQASALAAEYDRLSPLGEEQARRLGREWARRGTVFEQVYYGPRERQRRTAELALEACAGAGGARMNSVPLPALDEFRIEPLRAEFPRMAQERDDLRPYVSGFEPDAEPGMRMAALQKIGAALLRLWVNGEIGAPGAERWIDFRARIDGALEQMITAAQPRARLAAFTSAGVVGAAVQQALGLDGDHTLELMLVVRNASLTEFLFSRREGARFSLAAFNEVSHLAGEDGLVTLL